jgi:eukaryotic-like serine/threonine-protein kinase
MNCSETGDLMEPDNGAKHREAGSSGERRVFPVGHLVAGRYAIVRFIGAGGASEVYEAKDGGLGVNVALKVLNPLLAQNAVQLERFRREIQSARKVTHRNVCRIFDLGVEQVGNSKRFFLTMELLGGSTLADALAAGRRYSPADALPIVTQVAAGLQAAHDAGIVHRDLKPGNILLVPASSESGQDGGGARAAITDFGLAVSDEQTRLTRSDELVGTPDYMAPEQSEPGALTPAADVYALGLIIYEMLTGRLPFDTGPTPVATVLLRKQTSPRALRALLPDVDPAWEATVERCLEREPEHRFHRAMDIAASLTGQAPPRKPPKARR